MCLIFWWKDDCKTRPFFLALLLLFTFFHNFFFATVCVLISWCPFVCRPLCSLLIPFCLAFVPWPFRFDFCYLRVLWCSSLCVYAPKKKKKFRAHVSLTFFAFTCMHAHCGTSPGEICFVCLPPLCLQSRCFHGAPSSLQALLPDPLYLICGL